jgi:hypothetical protein
MPRFFSVPLLVLSALLGALPAAAQNAAPTSAAPASNEKPTLIILDLQARNTDKDMAALVTAVLGTSFEQTGIFQVRTESDVRQAMDFEADKESMGCDTDSCLAEIAGAMGAQFVAHGTVGALGNTTLVTVSLYEHAKAKSLGRERVQVEDKAKLPEKMDEMVKSLVAGTGLEVPEKEGQPDSEVASEGGATSSPLFWTGAALLGVGAAAGIGLGIWAAMLHAEVADGSRPPEPREDARDQGFMVTLGAIGGGMVAILGGGLMAIPLMSE